MSSETSLLLLMGTAAFLGFFHTLVGPDHYVPFVVIAKARRWSLLKTAWITFLCGLGHVGSSIVIGGIGIAIGIAVGQLEKTEGHRGDIAAWLLTAFGVVYMLWGIRRAIRNRPHTHRHFHKDGHEHVHEHVHQNGHLHVHDAQEADKASWKSLTPWVLFIVFVFGPCEPLIPLLMFPATKFSVWGVVLVSAVFAVATIGTMLTIVLLTSQGLNFLPMRKFERYSHALAGLAITACGVMIFMGL